MGDDEHGQLVSLLLDGLDDLYDQRYATRQQSSEVWLARLFVAAAIAYKDTKWEKELQDVSTALSAIIRSGAAPDDRGDAALAVTAGLRHALAAEA